jgi:transcriptional regulator with XRE-family HTH domain
MPRGHVLPDGQTIAILRGEAGLTQDELAVRAGYGLRTIGNIEGSHPTTSPTLAAIATVLSDRLGRQVGLGDLLVSHDTPPREGYVPAGSVVVSDNVQWLEFCDTSAINGAARASRPRAVLTDTHALSYVSPKLPEIAFSYYAMTRDLFGRSLSHQDDAQWIRPREKPHEEGVGDGAPSGATLRIRMPETSRSRPIVMQNRVEYFADLEAPEPGYFQTEVHYPTDCLTLVVQFPVGRRWRTLSGTTRKNSAAAFRPAVHAPLELIEGRVAHWRIVAPTPGETWRLSWS